MPLPENILSKLRAHQWEPAQRLYDILSTNPSAVDFSDTGTGKTFVASAVAVMSRLPTLVVVPKVAITAWERAATHFNDKFSVINYEMLRTGRTPYGKWDNNPPTDFSLEEFFVCQCCQRKFDPFAVNFEKCYCHPLGIHCGVVKKKPWRYGNFNFHPGVKHVIFDEVHRCNGLDSNNADMLIAARRNGKKILGLSATAACSPIQMRALGFALDLHALDYDTLGGRRNFYSWAAHYGCRRIPMQGMKWMCAESEQRTIMANIRNTIIPARGVRVTVDEIPGFPERDITSELYDLDENTQIDRLYNDMASALSVLGDKIAGDKNADHPLTVILRARQKVELLKVPIAVELARDYLEKGYSVAIFVNFRQTLVELGKRLHCSCIIDGSPDGVRNRQKAIDSFQDNSSRLILANSQAGGIAVSLHDLKGGFPRVGLVFPGFSADTMRQVLGRLHRDGGQSKCHYRVMFAARTVETKVHNRLKVKLNNLDALNDADLMPENLSLIKSTWTN